MGKKFLLSSILAALLLDASYAIDSSNTAESFISKPNPIENNITNKMFAESEIIITFKDDTNMSAVDSKLPSLFSSFTKHDYGIIKAIHLKVPSMAYDTIKEKIETEFNSSIKTIEPNYAFTYNEASNDSYYDKLWAIENTGQEVNDESGDNDADMDVKEAWDISKGDNDIVVAVLDTGVDYTHNDLADNMWRGNANHGYDFAGDDDGNNDDNPMPDSPYDEDGHYHGTHVAGTIGAVGNNDNGISGVVQDVQIMAIKVFRPNGYGYSSDILEGLDYISDQIDNGVKVVAINASYGGGGGSNGDSMDQAIQKLGDKGVVFCAAAGNDGKNIDDDPVYPASYSATNIITVAASDQYDKLASFSNYGKDTVEVTAPGTNILSTYPDNQYAYLQGTSMATPNVTGVVALLSSVNSNSSVNDLINAIKDNVDTKDDLSSYVSTEGRVNAYKAANSLNSSSNNSDPVANDDSATTDEDKYVLIDVLSNDSDQDGDTLSIVSVEQPSNGTAEISDNKIKYTPNSNFNGSDNFNYTISDDSNAQSSATVDVKVESVNDAPIAKEDDVTTKEDTKVIIDALSNDSDVDNDELTIKSVESAQHGDVKIVDNKIEYTPNSNYTGSDTFKYTITDNNGADSTADVNVNIEGENDAPVAKDDSVDTNINTTVTIDVLENDSDTDGDTITIKSVTQPQNGETTIDNGKVKYTPNDNYTGSDTFSYTIKDENGAEDSAIVTVTVNEEENSAPVAKDDGTYYIPKNTTKELDVLSNDSDADGDSLIIKSVTAPSHGTATITESGLIEYTPNKDYSGSDVFTYIVSDKKNGEDEAKVTIMVQDETDSTEHVFPIIGDNKVEIPTKIIGEFVEKVEDGMHIFELEDDKGSIVVDENTGEVKLENIDAPTPDSKLPSGTVIEVSNNKLKATFKLNADIKFK